MSANQKMIYMAKVIFAGLLTEYLFSPLVGH
jgi:hypothetical protein